MISSERVKLSAVVLFCLLVSLPPVVMLAKNFIRFELNLSTLFESNDFKLRNGAYSPQLALNYVRDNLLPGECSLVLRQAEFAYYQNSCIVSYLDPRLINFYQLEDTSLALEELHKLKIRFIVAPVGYGMAEVNNSPLKKILSSSQYSSIALHSDSLTLHELGTPQVPTKPLHEATLKPADFKVVGRYFSGKILHTGSRPYTDLPKYYKSDLYQQGVRTELHGKFTGSGFYRLILLDYQQSRTNKVDEWVSFERLLWEGMVGGDTEMRVQFVRNIGDSKRYRLLVKGPSSLDPRDAIIELKLTSYAYDSKNNLLKRQERAIANGWNISSEPLKNSKFLNWGLDSQTQNFSARMINDRRYIISKLNVPHREFKSMKLNFELGNTKSKAKFYLQWLNDPGRFGWVSWFRRFDRSISEPTIKQKVKQLQANRVIRHQTTNGLSDQRTSSFESLLSADNKELTVNRCINTQIEADQSRLLILVEADKSKPVHEISEVNVNNYQLEVYDSTDCQGMKVLVSN